MLADRVARRVRELRAARGLSRDELAMKAGLALTHIGQVERGANVTLRTLEVIAGALDIAPAELLDEGEALVGRDVAELLRTLPRAGRTATLKALRAVVAAVRVAGDETAPVSKPPTPR